MPVLLLVLWLNILTYFRNTVCIPVCLCLLLYIFLTAVHTSCVWIPWCDIVPMGRQGLWPRYFYQRGKVCFCTLICNILCDCIKQFQWPLTFCRTVVYFVEYFDVIILYPLYVPKKLVQVDLHKKLGHLKNLLNLHQNLTQETCASFF